MCRVSKGAQVGEVVEEWIMTSDREIYVETGAPDNTKYVNIGISTPQPCLPRSTHRYPACPGINSAPLWHPPLFSVVTEIK